MMAVPRAERPSGLTVLLDMELERLQRAMKAGVTLAVPAALDFCLEHDIEPPSWLVQAASDLLCDLLKREKSNKRGRSAGGVARYRQDMVDFIRWNEVDVLRDHQQRSAEFFSEYPTCPSPGRDTIFAERVAKAKWLGSSLAPLYECVSEVLERTDAFGSPESIKRSYRQVQQRSKDPSQAYRYCLLPYPFLEKVGIEGDLGYGRHAKIAAWRDSPRLKQKKPTRGRVSR